jgi:hypothetical protein
MNRLTLMAISALTAAATAASALGVASAASATTLSTTAGSRPAAVARCVASHRNYPYPTRAETFKAMTAGSVTIAPINSGTIRVTHLHAATGWHAYVDTGSGSSVDVYFRSGRHMVKFEAEINDAGGLTVTLTKCG